MGLKWACIIWTVELQGLMKCRKRAKRGGNDGLRCHRYALKLTCQTLKVCTLTHASLNTVPTMQCCRDLSEN